MCYKIFRGGNLKCLNQNGIGSRNSEKSVSRAFVNAALLAAGLATIGAAGAGLMNCSPKNNPVKAVNPLDTTAVDTTKAKDTTKVNDTTTIYTGAPGAPLPCNVPLVSCIGTGSVVLFGEVPIKYMAAKDTSGSSVLEIAKVSGKLYTTIPAVAGQVTMIDLGLDSGAIAVDTVYGDRGATKVQVSVMKICNGVEMCAPTVYLDCSSGGSMTSPCMPLGTTFNFGEYAVRLDGIDLSTPTKLKAMISVLRYDCTVARADTIAELKTDTLYLGTRTAYVTVNDIHATILPDSSVTPALPKKLDRVNSCATITVSDCQK